MTSDKHITAAAIGARLDTRLVGSHIECLRTATSTSDQARLYAQAGAPEGTVIIAEEQTAGRGRRGREWRSIPGQALTLSVLLRPLMPPSLCQHLSLLAALGCCRAIQGLTGLEARPKWPNDVIVNQRKVGGVLVEMLAEAERIEAAIVGIGINVKGTAADLGDDLAGTASTLEEQAGAPVSRLELACGVLGELDELYCAYCEQGPEPLLEMWRASDLCLGQWVRVTTEDRTIEGRAEGITPEGCLLVVDSRGESLSLLAGDVTIRQ